MRERPLSECIVRRRGSRPIVVFAPHGGRRTRPLRRGDGINDLYTAEIASELAERLDAHAIVNVGIDRNDVDLNRISELVARAPDVLGMLREAVEAARGESGSVPLVLLIHGWNVSSLHCDIGIGLRRRDGELVGAQPTVAPETLATFVEPLCRELDRRGLTGYLGHRYPASGVDNTTQLFSGRHGAHAHPEVTALASLALDGCVDAVQLELSIVLRWPGEHRESFVSALESAALAHVAARAEATSRDAAAEVETRERPPTRNWARCAPKAAASGAAEPGGGARRFAGESLQAVLANGGGLFMAIEPADRRSLAARVCVALPDGRLALFVCEAPQPSGECERVVAGGLGWHLGGRARFAGPAVLYPTHDAFLDLEQGLGGATLADLEVDVGACGESESGVRPSGYVRVNDQSIEVTGALVRRSGERLGGGSPPIPRVYFTDDDAPAPLVIEQHGPTDAKTAAVACDGRDIVARHPVLGELRGELTVRIPVYRPTGDGRYLAILFGIAELGDGRVRRRALFETVDLLELSA